MLNVWKKKKFRVTYEGDTSRYLPLVSHMGASVHGASEWRADRSVKQSFTLIETENGGGGGRIFIVRGIDFGSSLQA
jgi:hypothetical protein